jgi:hypothetical protein
LRDYDDEFARAKQKVSLKYLAEKEHKGRNNGGQVRFSRGVVVVVAVVATVVAVFSPIGPMPLRLAVQLRALGPRGSDKPWVPLCMSGFLRGLRPGRR